jgi:hypothetical protein
LGAESNSDALRSSFGTHAGRLRIRRQPDIHLIDAEGDIRGGTTHLEPEREHIAVQGCHHQLGDTRRSADRVSEVAMGRALGARDGLCPEA